MVLLLTVVEDVAGTPTLCLILALVLCTVLCTALSPALMGGATAGVAGVAAVVLVGVVLNFAKDNERRIEWPDVGLLPDPE